MRHFCLLAFAFLLLPPCAFAESPVNDELAILAALHETSPLVAARDEAYRVLVLPTFTEPFALRLERQGPRWRLVSACLSGEGGYEPGQLEALVTSDPAPATVAAFVAALQAALTSLEESDVICLDGTTWVYEHSTPSSYTHASRYCPEESFVRPGRLLALAAPLLFSEVAPQPLPSQPPDEP
jgi:hypothetical protein